MKEPKKDDSNEVSSRNVLRIADELVRQVDLTKKLVALMILVVIIAVPVSWHVAPLLTTSPARFMLAGYVTIAVALAFLAIGVRQWLALSKWTKKYKAYKEMQKRVDAKLDFEGDAVAEEEGEEKE